MLPRKSNIVFTVCVLTSFLIKVVFGVGGGQEIGNDALEFVERLSSVKNFNSTCQSNTNDIFVKSYHEDIVVIDEYIRMLKSLKALEGSYDKQNLKNIFQADEFNCSSTLDYRLDERILSMNLTPLNLGIKAEGSHIVTVIPLNTTTPTRKTRVFSTFTDNQSTAKIQIYEGLDIWSSYNHLLGEVILSDLVVSPSGVPQIKVTFTIDINNILTVEVDEKLSGQFRSIHLGHPKERINQEILEMVTSRDYYYQEDETYLCEYYRALTSFGNYIHLIRNELAYNGELTNQLNGDGKRILEKEVKRRFAWFDENFYTFPENFDKERKEMEFLVISVLTKYSRSTDNTKTTSEHDEL